MKMRIWRLENTYIVVGNENAPATVKNSLVDLKNRSTIGPLILSLVIYLKEMKIGVQIKTYT